MWVNLKRDGPFGPKKVPGRVRIALTYKSYVDEEEEGADEKEGSFSPYIKVYGDSGAESVEDIGVSLGEAVEASLMEEAKRKGVTMTDEDEPEIPIVSIPRQDSSVEVSNASSSASNGNVRSTNGAAVPSRHTNGAAAASRQKVDATRHGNRAASSRQRVDDTRHSNGAAVRRDDATEESFAYPRSFGDNGDVARGFGDNGDVRVPRSGEEGGDVHRELESLIRRSGSGAHEEGADPHSIPSDWKRSSSSHPSSPATRPDHHNNKEFLFETEAESETTSEPEGKSDGNKILWLCMFTTVAYIIGCSLHLSNPLHP